MQGSRRTTVEIAQNIHTKPFLQLDVSLSTLNPIYHPVCKTIAELSCRYNGFGPWQAEAALLRPHRERDSEEGGNHKGRKENKERVECLNERENGRRAGEIGPE